VCVFAGTSSSKGLGTLVVHAAAKAAAAKGFSLFHPPNFLRVSLCTLLLWTPTTPCQLPSHWQVPTLYMVDTAWAYRLSSHSNSHASAEIATSLLDSIKQG